jgi:hypothetical protein
MPRNLHDTFIKDWMKEMLSDFGTIEVEREISSEIQAIDLVFFPTDDAPYDRSTLGLLGRMIDRPCGIEAFRNTVPEWEICNCRHKRFVLSGELHRLARAKPTNRKTPLNPFLWILTPTFGDRLQKEFCVWTQPSWGPGIYFLPNPDHTAIVVIHQLPKTLDTLWLRLLGRDRVQADAIEELLALPPDHPYGLETLHHVTVLQANLKARQNRNKAIHKVIMSISTSYKKWYAETIQAGHDQGVQQGMQEGMQQGMQQERQALALKMLQAGASIEFVTQVTGYSIEELDALPPQN